jgi:hypothetical protein
MIKVPCNRCGCLHTRRGMMILEDGAYCKKCIRSGYWPEQGHMAVGDVYRAVRDRLFPGEGYP